MTFDEVLEFIGKVHVHKGEAGYGNHLDEYDNLRRCERMGIPAWQGALIRAGDKDTRTENMLKAGRPYEELYDNLLDRAVYGVLILKLYLDYMQMAPVLPQDETTRYKDKSYVHQEAPLGFPHAICDQPFPANIRWDYDLKRYVPVPVANPDGSPVLVPNGTAPGAQP